MLSRSLIFGVLFSLPQFVIAQGTTVPSSLSSGFDPSAIQLQVSFTGDASNGFNDGSTINLQQTSNTPTFALGDSSGISTTLQFVVMMLDTTDQSNMALHFLQAGLKSDGEKTQISSQSQPQFAYKKPGSLSEKGQRQYSFLLFRQTGGGNLNGVPTDGSKFDVNSFISGNGLKSAQAGVAMKVDVGGGSGNGNGGQSSQSSQAPASSAPASSGNGGGNSQTTSTATVVSGSTSASNAGSPSSTFGPVTFQSPSIAGTSAATGMSTVTGSAGESGSTSATEAAGSTATLSTTAGAGAGTSPSGSAGASGGASASASQVGTNGAAAIRSASGVLLGLFALFVGCLL